VCGLSPVVPALFILASALLVVKTIARAADGSRGRRSEPGVDADHGGVGRQITPQTRRNPRPWVGLIRSTTATDEQLGLEERHAAEPAHRAPLHGFRNRSRPRHWDVRRADGSLRPRGRTSGIANSTTIVITGGLAEIAAGSIAMGLGGYLAARSDAEHYATERATERRAVDTVPEAEVAELEQVLVGYGLENKQSNLVARPSACVPKRSLIFMMRVELGLNEPDPKRALRSALTIGFSYIGGGLCLWHPTCWCTRRRRPFLYSIGFTLLALFVFGYVKVASPALGRSAARSRPH